MDSKMYCRNCGTKIVGPAEKCFKCRSDPFSGNAYCPGCGCQTKYFVKNCLTCGAPLAYIAPKTSIINPKSKRVSILLALCLGLFTWLYTYQKDAKKFWLSLGLTVLGLILFFSPSKLVFGNSFTFGAPAGPNVKMLLLLMVAFVVVSGIWAWSLLDVMRKTNEWYTQYPNQ
jgi:hypothetical protein